MLESELVRKKNAERQHKKQKRKKGCEQQRLNNGCTVSRWGRPSNRRGCTASRGGRIAAGESRQ
jgi:hypothetical protein